MRFTVLIFLSILLAACAPQAAMPVGDGLPVMATNPILADVVSRVGGEHVRVITLIPAGVDPHAFEATPQDVAKLDVAALVFINGLHLEESLEPLLHEVEEAGKLVNASDGIVPLSFEYDHIHEDEHYGEDPHVWWNPANINVWVDNIVVALSAVDPANAASYQANAAAYKSELAELDAWIVEQVASLPAANRKLVVDHQSLNYFAERYGFESVGTLVASFSTLSEASAGELAELEHAMEDLGVRAIFVGNSTNPSLAERVSTDTGLQVVPLYIETLSPPQGPAGSYLELMRYNVSAIIIALN